MELSSSDKNVVHNIRYRYKDKVEKYTDLQIVKCWRMFSQSDDWSKDQSLFLEWLEDWYDDGYDGD